MYKKLFLILLFIGCSSLSANGDNKPKIRPSAFTDELTKVAKEVAEMFYYEKEETGLDAKNIFIGKNEIGGRCGDYALAFVNIWNKRYPGQARLVIQILNQDRRDKNQFTSGIYKVVGKVDENSMPPGFEDWVKKNMSVVSRLNVNGNEILAVSHPALGSYEIRLSQKLNIAQHFGTKLESNHAWVIVGNVHVDPTWGDTGGENSFISHNTW
jgi:hypothetical protein